MKKQLFEHLKLISSILMAVFTFLFSQFNALGQCTAPPVYTSIGGNAEVLCEGSAITPFTLNFTGATSFQWQRSPITGTPNFTNVPGQTTNTLSLSNIAKADEGLYRLVATNACGSTNSANTLQLQVRLKPVITTNPVASKSVCQGTTLSLSVGVGGNALSLTWYKDDVPISGQPTINLSVSNFQASNVGNYHAVVQPLSQCAGFTATSSKSSVSLATNIAFDTQPPASQNICAGSNLVLAPTITGTATAYQWKKGGGNIAGQTNPTYSANNVNSLTAGNYSVVITGACNTLTSGNYAVSVTPNASISSNPASVSKCVGENHTFNASAFDASRVEWLKDGSAITDGGNISGATTNSLTITNINSTLDVGTYSFRAYGSGACTTESVTSNTATLSINQPITISSTTPSLSKLAGENVTLEVVAIGSITGYQWKKNGNSLIGKVNASLQLNNLSLSDNGLYSVDIFSNCGTETSEGITLEVLSPGFYVESGASLSLTDGGGLSLTNTKLVNNGTVTSTNGTLTLKGDATTTIEGTGQTQLNHLTIDNSQQNVELRKNISVSGDLTLTSGNLSLVSGNIDFGTTGKIMNETETNRIFGTGGYLLANANLNAPNNTNPANLGAIIKSTANLGETVIKRIHTPLNVRNAGIERVYEVTPTNNTNLNASLKLKYFDAELNGNIKNALRAWKSEDNGSTWVYLPSGNDVVGNELLVSNVPGMGLFTGHVECPQFIINTVAPLCERETLNLGLNPTDDEATYNWTGPNGFNANTAQATRQNLLPTDAGIYTLTAIKNGCTTTATTNVVVNPLPAIPTITTDNMEICKGGTVVLSGNCSTAQASFRWLAAKFEGSQTSALPSSNSRTITEPGVYSGLCESKEGCLSDQVSITINQAADCNGQNFIVLTPEKPAICPGQSITMTANGCAGTVTWLGGPTNLTGNTAVFSPGTTTGYLANCSTGGSASFQIVVATTNLAVATNISTGKERFKAVQTLTSNKKVGDANFTPGANVIYEAGGAIILEPGFTAEKWSVFRAEIKTCN
ncbi:MAG: hypothetical protein U0V04_08660 [Spirosomataceae bacterium]